MSKLTMIIQILQLLVQLAKDTDGDGRPDVIDADPLDPKVK